MTTETVSQAVERRNTGPEARIMEYKDSFAAILPSHIKIDQFTSLAIYALRANKTLQKAAAANPGSFIAALLDCSRLGLQPGETYHLVPFGNEIVGIVDWTGEVELIYNAGAVSSVIAEVVYANDKFDFRPGVHERPIHEPEWFSGDRGAMIGVYAYAILKDGATSKVVVLNKAEIEKIKAVSKTAKSATSPWNQWPDRMWRKSAVKQLAKWVPSSPEIRSRQVDARTAVEQVRETHPEIPAPVSDDKSPGTPLDENEVIEAEIVDDTCSLCGVLGPAGHDVELHESSGIPLP